MDKPSRIPRHVSIIMDGNGRWAKERGKERIFGHKEGVESVRSVLESSMEWGIEYLSVYAFSEENWGRPEDEVSGLMALMAQSMLKEFSTFMDKKVRFVVLGNRSRLPENLNRSIDSMMEATAANTRLVFIVFLSYSGKWDILQAARKMAHDLIDDPEREVSLDDFSHYLVTDGIPDPELLIRTSGEKRLSNYLLWQSAYTEFVFSDVLWPDFRKEEFKKALDEYALRDRRFGKVK